MVSVLEINKKIIEHFKNEFKNTYFENVEISAQDVSEPIVRPSLKVILEAFNPTKFNKYLTQRSLTFRLYFFAKDFEKPKIDNLKMIDAIETGLLKDIKITDTFILSIVEDETDFVETDGVLICTIVFETLEDIPQLIVDDGVEYENMENLDLEMKENY